MQFAASLAVSRGSSLCSPNGRGPLPVERDETIRSQCPYTLLLFSVPGDNHDALTNRIGDRILLPDIFLRHSCDNRPGRTTGGEPDALHNPGAARGTALATLRYHRGYQRLSGPDPGRQDGPFRRLLRRRLLDDSLGFSLRRPGRTPAAEPALVGSHARSVGARDSFQAGAHVRVLAAMPLLCEPSSF